MLLTVFCLERCLNLIRQELKGLVWMSSLVYPQNQQIRHRERSCATVSRYRLQSSSTVSRNRLLSDSIVRRYRRQSDAMVSRYRLLSGVMVSTPSFSRTMVSRNRLVSDAMVSRHHWQSDVMVSRQPTAGCDVNEVRSLLEENLNNYKSWLHLAAAK